MTFNAFELSKWLAKPVRLYRFDRQHLSWRFTGVDRNITVGADTYLAVRGDLTSTSIRDTSNAKKSEVKIAFPYLLDPAAPALPVTQSLGDNWRPYPPDDEVAVTIMDLHHGDPDQELRVVWSGVVAAPAFTDTELTLTCMPSHVGSRKSGLALRSCRGCPLVHYSQGRGMCNVDPVAHEFSATLTGVTGLTLTAAAFGALPADRLAGGTVRWTQANGLVARRSILSHTGTSVTITHGHAELVNGLVLTGRPGCKHNWEDCTTYYNNGDNYGGRRFLPVKSLFDGNRHIA